MCFQEKLEGNSVFFVGNSVRYTRAQHDILNSKQGNMPCPCVSYEFPYHVSFRFQARISPIFHSDIYYSDMISMSNCRFHNPANFVCRINFVVGTEHTFN